jgi:hypothetical protein
MTETNEIRELFHSYAEEVGRYLPYRKRKDIQMEILSLLKDSLEDLSSQQGRPADEEMAVALLKEYGPPIKFASAYSQEENIISPETFQLFKPVATLVGGLLIVELLITAGALVGNPWSAVWPQLGMWFEKVFTALGVVVFSFAILERTTPKSWLIWPIDQRTQDWDPAGLKKRLRKKPVRRRKYWVEIIWLVLLLILFGFFPQWVRVAGIVNGKWHYLPILTKNFSIYQPWLMLYFIGRLMFCTSTIRQGYLDNRLRLSQIALKAFGVGLLFALLVGPPVVGINYTYVILHEIPASIQSWVRPGGVVPTVFYLMVGINLVAHAIALGYQVIRLFRDHSSTNSFSFKQV